MEKRTELIVTPFGLIALRGGKVVETLKFGETLEENVDRYRKLTEEGVVDEKIKTFIKGVIDKTEAYTSSPVLARIFKRAGLNVELVEEPEVVEVSELLVKSGLFKRLEEAEKGIREALNLISIQKIREKMIERDRVVIHAIEAYDEYTELINTLYERLREWYGLHFPELEKLVRKYTTYSRIVEKLGRKENFSLEKLVELGVDRKTAEKIVKAVKSSIGVELGESDMKQITEHAKFLSETIRLRDRLEKYIDNTLSECAPNLMALIGPKLAAKLISKAGGLRRLSTLPASTVQLLGAEKALFRALRKGTKPPKHGIIFQHPAISRAPRAIRGKISRTLAAKIVIAARVDVFGTEVIGERLKRDFEKKVKEIYKRIPRRRKRK